MDIYIIAGRYWFADNNDDYCNFGYTFDKNEVEEMVNKVFETESEIDNVGYQHWRDKTILIDTQILKKKNK